MDEIVDKCRASSTMDSKQATPQTTFGLVTLNHFGISVRDLDRSIAFYRALTGQEPESTGNWSSTGLGSAAGIGDSSSRTAAAAAIHWATFRINNVNIDLVQIKKESGEEEEEQPELWQKTLPWRTGRNACLFRSRRFGTCVKTDARCGHQVPRTISQDFSRRRRCRKGNRYGRCVF